MGIIKEPLHIDFEVESRSLTKDEEAKISEFIKKRKEELIRKKKTHQKNEKAELSV